MIKYRENVASQTQPQSNQLSGGQVRHRLHLVLCFWLPGIVQGLREVASVKRLEFDATVVV